ncbi:hypothetical protein LOZ53_003584 [Ophidiomyces ophidiicola]|nr:hypothetical protein LOZ64_004677 [Ophidiomyces ophidiicola]KAI1970291.1 hypothetical protein LOZ56_003765 [Ophidiomyces ophidiicola]KAI1977659.1 hypothetical protein LOZ55_003261 [Ophidiomyces ophidiicola]KAI1980538.1 hypothetical protein LOZ54_005821 [Ophidiomyces ophidiicola]KAI1989524.1 hypothetical protein LOZ53_003584 [Ophidiomyces ophidiicola]
MRPGYAITDVLPLPKSSVKIPRLGFGVYKSPTSVCENSCLAALEAGYRHIDTAQFYANEQEVGDAIRASGLERGDIFVTTKIMTPAGSSKATYDKVLDSVRKIGGEDGYVDLFLIHSASAGATGRKEMWLALEKLLEEGKTRSIGVSNYGVKHIEEMKHSLRVFSDRNILFQLHPWCQQRVVDAYCKKHGIVIEAYCPLVRNYKGNAPVLVDLANKYGRTTAQILLRYSLQKNWVPLPKSDNPERIRANANIYDFRLADEDMTTLDDLEMGADGAIVQAVENE